MEMATPLRTELSMEGRSINILNGMQILINAMKLLNICCTNLANDVCQCSLPWTIGGEGRGGSALMGY